MITQKYLHTPATNKLSFQKEKYLLENQRYTQTAQIILQNDPHTDHQALLKIYMFQNINLFEKNK